MYVPIDPNLIIANFKKPLTFNDIIKLIQKKSDKQIREKA